MSLCVFDVTVRCGRGFAVGSCSVSCPHGHSGPIFSWHYCIQPLVPQLSWLELPSTLRPSCRPHPAHPAAQVTDRRTAQSHPAPPETTAEEVFVVWAPECDLWPHSRWRRWGYEDYEGSNRSAEHWAGEREKPEQSQPTRLSIQVTFITIFMIIIRISSSSCGLFISNTICTHYLMH